MLHSCLISLQQTRWSERGYCCPLVGNIISCQRRQICCDTATSGMNLATDSGEFGELKKISASHSRLYFYNSKKVNQYLFRLSIWRGWLEHSLFLGHLQNARSSSVEMRILGQFFFPACFSTYSTKTLLQWSESKKQNKFYETSIYTIHVKQIWTFKDLQKINIYFFIYIKK